MTMTLSIFLQQRLAYVMLESDSNVGEEAICFFNSASNVNWTVSLFSVVIWEMQKEVCNVLKHTETVFC